MIKLNRKGFTLIELLAVIVILSILVMIAVPKVLQLFKNAKKNAFEVEARNIVNAAEQAYSNSTFKGNITDTTYTYTDGAQSKTGNITMNISGRKIKDGKINITSMGKIEITIHDGKYCATKDFDSNNIIVEEKPLEECLTVVTAIPETCFLTDLSLANPTVQNYYAYTEYMSQSELELYGIVPLSEIQSNEAVIYAYDYTNPNCPSDVIIPEEINNKSVVSIGLGAFMNLSTNQGIGITSIKFPSTLKYIEYYSFYKNQITSLTIPSHVTMIGMNTFLNNLITTLTIPSNVLSIGENAFMFNQITNLEIENGITNIAKDAFFNNQITSLVLPNSLTRIEENTFGKNQLTSVDLPDNLIYLSGFSENPLSSISIPNTVTTIGENAFKKNSFTSITIPNSVTLIDFNAFTENQLTSVTLSDHLVTIGIQAFAYNSLTNVTIPTTVTDIQQNAFWFNELTGVAIPNSVTTIGERAFEYNNITDGNLTIDNTIGSVSILTDAFAHNGTYGNETIIPYYLRSSGDPPPVLPAD